MADDSQPIKYVYVDSTNRDTSIWPTGDTYTLHLTNPLRSIVQVDLVAAKVPNTMYNLNDGSNVFIFTNLVSGVVSNVSISPGYYSAPGLAQALMNSAGCSVFCMDFVQDEGKYLFSSNVQFTLQGTTSEIRTLLGIPSGTLQSFYSSSSPVYTNDTNYQGRWLYKSPSIINLAQNEYVFLDIDEFRTTSVIDAKKLVGPTTDGSSIRSTFGMVPMDVPSGMIKNFKETTDYNQYIKFSTPIPKVHRLTIRWTDSKGKPLNFQTFNNNAFTLRIHCEYPKEPEPPPPPPVTMVELRRILDDMITVQKPKEVARPLVGRWTLAIIFVLLVAGYLIYKATRPVAAVVQPVLAPRPVFAQARVTA